MSAGEVVVQGTLREDGTLVLDEKPGLPPGRVRVAVRPLWQPTPEQEQFWAAMEKIWADQKARGHVPRTREEIDAELNQLRDEAEQEL